MDGHDGGGHDRGGRDRGGYDGEAAVARLDEPGAEYAAAPVARLGTEQPGEPGQPGEPDRPGHLLADLDGIAGHTEAAPGFAAPVADFRTGPDGDAPGRLATILQFEAGRVARLGATTARRGGARRPARPATEEEPDEQRRKGARRRTGRFGTPRPDPPGDRGSEGDSPAGEGRGRSGRGRQELDPDADPVTAAREICLQLLAGRACTRQELAQALRRRGIPDEAADAVLERFDDVGLIDDAAFAGQWVRSSHARRGLARRAIAFELRRKGVSDEDAGAALAEVDAESEERRARELVERKLRSLAVATADQRVAAARRLVGVLARKGYGPGLAYRVVKEVLAERGAEPDELGDAEPPDD